MLLPATEHFQRAVAAAQSTGRLGGEVLALVSGFSLLAATIPLFSSLNIFVLPPLLFSLVSVTFFSKASKPYYDMYTWAARAQLC